MADNKKKIEIDLNTKLDSAQTETNLRKLNLLLKDLQSELNKITDQSSADWQRVSSAISEVESKIGDAKDRLGTITGEPLERVNAGLGLVSEGLMNLDFDKATIGLKGMRDGLGKLDFNKVSAGVKNVGKEFLGLAKDLVKSPIFLIGSAIALIITNFDKLQKAGGAIGSFFKGIGDAIKSVTDAIVTFTDAIGLTKLKTDELAEYNKKAASSLSDYYDVVADGEIAVKQALNQSTLGLELEKQTRARDKAVEALLDIYKKEINTEEERNEARQNIYKIGLKNLQKFFKEQYGIVEGGLEALEKVYEEQEKLEQTYVNRQVQNAKELIGIIKENEKNRISLIGNSLTKELELIKLNNTLTENERKEKKERLLNDVEEQNKISTIGTVKLGEEAKKYTQKRLEQEDKLSNLLTLHKKYLGQKSYDILARQEMEQNIANVKGKIKFYTEAEQQIYNLQAYALTRYLGQKSQIEKTFSDQEKNQSLKDQKDRQQLLLAEKIKANENEQEAARQKFEKDNEYIDLSLQDKLNLESDYYYKVLDLQEKNYKLQIQKDGLTEQDKLRIRLEYNKKTEDAYKIHVKNVDNIFGEGIDNLTAMAESAGSGVGQTLEQHLKEINDYFDELNKKRLNDQLETADSELATLQSHQETITNFKLRSERNLIEKIADLRKQANEKAMAEELRLLDVGLIKQKENLVAGSEEEKRVIDATEVAKEAVRAKYAAKAIDIEQNATDQKLKANEKFTQKVIDLAQYSMDVANSLADIANAKDEKNRDENGKLDVQFQERIFKRNQNFQIANAIMNTATAVTAALASSAGANWPAAIAAAAAGAAQIAKIKATKFEPEGGYGGAGGSDKPEVNAPEMAETPKNPFFSQGYMSGISPNGSFGFRPGQDSSGQRVYVLEQDIRNMNNKVKVIETRSTLSGF